MKTQLFSKSTRTCLFGVALSSMLVYAHAQSAPQPTVPMPAEIVKTAPKTGMEMKQGMDTKQGAHMTQSMDMKPMMTDMHNQMMGMKSSGNADVDFAMMMRIHHQGAITMGEAQLQNGKDPQMRAMAKDIIRAQKKEIAAFDKFLAKRGEAGMKTNK